MEPKTGRSYVAEFVGTFLLVFFICLVVSLTSREALGLHRLGRDRARARASCCRARRIARAASAARTSTRRSRSRSPRCARSAAATPAIYILMQLARRDRSARWSSRLVDRGRGQARELRRDADLQGVPGRQLQRHGARADRHLRADAGRSSGAASTPRNKSDWAPWVIGGALGAGRDVIGPLTGAGFNPARAFGPTLVSGELGASSASSSSSTCSARSSARCSPRSWCGTSTRATRGGADHAAREDISRSRRRRRRLEAPPQLGRRLAGAAAPATRRRSVDSGRDAPPRHLLAQLHAVAVADVPVLLQVLRVRDAPGAPARARRGRAAARRRRAPRRQGAARAHRRAARGQPRASRARLAELRPRGLHRLRRVGLRARARARAAAAHEPRRARRATTSRGCAR